MYTVCYTNKKGEDTYERCDDRQEVAALLTREGLLENDDDVLIFSPEAEDYLLDVEDVLS